MVELTINELFSMISLSRRRQWQSQSKTQGDTVYTLQLRVCQMAFGLSQILSPLLIVLSHDILAPPFLLHILWALDALAATI